MQGPTKPLPKLGGNPPHQFHHNVQHHVLKDPNSGVLLQPWVRIDTEGNSKVVREGRMKLITKLGIQGRDLRLLEEPPAGGTFLVREEAIIASLDFACVIITTKAAYVVNPSEPSAIKFMTMLKQRLAFSAANLAAGGTSFKTWQDKEQQLLMQAHAGAEKQGHYHLHFWGSNKHNPLPPKDIEESMQAPHSIEQQSPPKHSMLGKHTKSHHHLGSSPPRAPAPTPIAQYMLPPLSPSYSTAISAPPPPFSAKGAKYKLQHDTKDHYSHTDNNHHRGKAHFVPMKPLTLPVFQSSDTQQLPFELRVLELCLYELCNGLAIASSQLESVAMPLVDVLLNQAEVAVLEELRYAKKQLADLTTKAARACGLLKSLLDDDNDMWGMHLTAKEAQRAVAEAAAARMMEEVNAMTEHLHQMPTLEKVDEEEAENEPYAGQPQQPLQHYTTPSRHVRHTHGSLHGRHNIDDLVPPTSIGRPQPPPSSSNASSSHPSVDDSVGSVSENSIPPPQPPSPPPSAPPPTSSSVDFCNPPSVEHIVLATSIPPPRPSSPPASAPPPPLSPPSKPGPQWINSGSNSNQGDGSRLSEQNLKRLGSPFQSIGMGLGTSPSGSKGGMDRGKSLRGNSNPKGSSSSSSGEFDQAVSQVEMLVESYYLQLDDTYNRLKAMADYIEDAEDMVHVHLDATQNVLISRDLIFAIISIIHAVLLFITQIFTLNLGNRWYQTPTWFFYFFECTVGLGSWVIVGSITFFLIYIYLYRVDKGRSWFRKLVP